MKWSKGSPSEFKQWWHSLISSIIQLKMIIYYLTLPQSDIRETSRNMFHMTLRVQQALYNINTIYIKNISQHNTMIDQHCVIKKKFSKIKITLLFWGNSISCWDQNINLVHLCSDKKWNCSKGKNRNQTKYWCHKQAWMWKWYEAGDYLGACTLGTKSTTRVI